jgi:acetyltransferase-like isoleucine patch superfamily enzyme/ubiquinone/menaquinone biosynthesis C-methylase UbiE
LQDKKAEQESWLVDKTIREGKYEPYDDQSYNELISKFLPKEFNSVLEVGCATGALTSRLNAERIVGVDISEDFIKIAGESLPFKDRSFDLVVGIYVIHHFVNPSKIITEMKRVGKTVVVVEPNAENPHVWLLMSPESPVRYDIQTVNERPVHRKMLESHGFGIDYIFLKNRKEDPNYLENSIQDKQKLELARIMFDVAHKHQKLCDWPNQANSVVGIYDEDGGTTNEVKEWVLKRYESIKMTDDERRVCWDLPEGVKIREFARLIPHDKWRENITFGKNVYIGEGTIVDGSEKVTIGEGTDIGAYSQLWTHSMSLVRTLRGEKITGPITIGKNCWIGGGVTIYPGITIGDRVMVLPNSVVNMDLPSDTTWGGVPVKEVRLTKDNIEDKEE